MMRLMVPKALARRGAALAAALVFLASAAGPALAYRGYYDDSRYYLNRHPYVKKAAIGGGIGAAAGALLSHDGRRVNGAVKGGLLGAGAGLGYEYLRQRGTFGGGGYRNRRWY